MDDMDHGHMHGGGMEGTHTTTTMHHKKMMMMHMTFFWGENAEILFSGWPGTNNTGMYVLSLVVVFVLSLLVELLSHSNLISRNSSDVAAGIVQTLMHGLRMGLAYLVMLAVMSFNGGVFLAALFGHVVGFFFFGSRVFKKPQNPPPYGKASDIPPMSC